MLPSLQPQGSDKCRIDFLSLIDLTNYIFWIVRWYTIMSLLFLTFIDETGIRPESNEKANWHSPFLSVFVFSLNHHRPAAEKTSYSLTWLQVKGSRVSKQYLEFLVGWRHVAIRLVPIQLCTLWWSADSARPHFNQASKRWRRISDKMSVK